MSDGKIRIVLADDTEQLRSLLKRVLERDGRFVVVAEAADGAAAALAAAEQQPDAVVLDLTMPVMDGLEALPRIKAASPRSKVLVLSALEEATASGAALAGGADAFIRKGEPLESIAALLHSLCA